MKGISETAQNRKSGKESLLRPSLYVPNFASRIREFYTFKPWISSFLCLAEATSPSEPPPRCLVWSKQGLHPLDQIHLDLKKIFFSSFFWPPSWLSWIWVIENTPLSCIMRNRWLEEPHQKWKDLGPSFSLSCDLSKSCNDFIVTFIFFLLKRGSIIPALNFLRKMTCLSCLSSLSSFSLSFCLPVFWPSDADSWVNDIPQNMSHCHVHLSRNRPLLFYLFSYFSSTSPIPTPSFSPHPTPRSSTYSNVYPLKNIWCFFVLYVIDGIHVLLIYKNSNLI